MADPTGAVARLLNGLTMDPSGSIVTGAQFEKIPGKTYYCSEDEAAAAGLPPGGWGPDDCTIPTTQLSPSPARHPRRQAAGTPGNDLPGRR